MPTVTRVLPWRRHTQPPAMEVQEIVDQYRRFHPKRPTETIKDAYRLAAGSHQGQLRRSGEPYITHPLAVAGIVARYGMDDVTISAALLHDAVEDTVLTLDEVESAFGPEVREIVDGVTKLERVHFDSKEAQQAATMRKMLVAMAKDLRVLVIKLADRLHNMRTLAAMPAWKQERTAQETLDIYAPLAHRLGMQEIKQQLEDLCFAALHPKRYAEIDHMVANRTPERDRYLLDVLDEVTGRLKDVNIVAEVTGRPKHLWSIYEKMVVKGKAFDEIFDLVGIRVIVDSSKDCYAALGTIHALWTPVPGRFKDYIAMPKFNLYQSLHTTVIGPGGRPLEVQIRTPEMHNRAEWGVAAHFSYKEGHSEDVAWLTRIVDWQQEMTDPGEFMANLKLDLDQDEVFVFTPKGDVVTLPLGATPVDFAYAIHTEVGHRCIGARVGGRLVPLDGALTSGDTVEIFTSKVAGAGPSRDWLNFVATRSASNKIRQWFSRERREDALESGREALVKALRREALPIQRVMGGAAVADVSHQLRFQSVDAMYAAIGEHHLSAEAVAARIAKLVRTAEGEREEVVSTPVRPAGRRRSRPAGVHVEGFDDVLVRMARCCTPVPGDEIMGFITRGRGVSVHRVDCANASSLADGQQERVIDVDWDTESAGDFVALVEVKALDRPRLLQDVTATLSEHHVNIISSQSHAGGDRVAKMRFEFELGESSHLDTLLSRIRTIDSVYDAYRVVPGAGA
ncbi:RelA/SpoT family protein [Dermatobacter hominis]|uniref:RelA/SpoT family protein n=1 Tax=Dermatobacter hominis TaxID=2884263 RepID=UPI001D0FC3FE|nr:bifunctional (p)ppGpp synthetase/guanosine-3',5'-bis(diphosphate) 3'-pyrophosphohydrolase [Dermatobacter hominis]UDY36167.1 bifunctional (p)ppGpp synthetase/guanosine-3',5'-bis(diphosphate) 3'-pyrophosphohydrolase [Dermatobacter hominis]